MKFPYQCLHVSGNILFAATGASIHSFKLNNGSYVDSWTHPNYKPTSTNFENTEAADGDSPVVISANSAESGTPPAKRRKLVIERDSQSVSNDNEDNENAEVEEANEAKKDTQRQRRKQKLAQQPKSPELPLVICLTGSSSGGHIVAVTSTDKTIWVFENDGKGNLKQLKQRPMPKRPSTIAITADDKTIVSADKFGDVYALPLIPSDAPPTSLAAGASPTPQTQTKPRGPQANELTVHSQRNLKALEDQRRNLEERLRKQSLNPDSEQQADAGDHTLLLGHVSMLTSLVLASSSVGATKPRDYLITADRDEHIRVSRGISQAHVIEKFCLGHESFVSRMCLLPRPGVSGETVLVSGGGDGFLFVWDWQAGRLLHKVPLLEHVGEEKLAVTGLLSARCPDPGSEDVDENGNTLQLFVLCELVPAIFIFRQTRNANLEFVQKVSLPGIPLDTVVVGEQGATSRFVCSILVPQVAGQDFKRVNSLLTMEPSSEIGWCLAEGHLILTQDVDGADFPRDEVEKLLFNVESLRKMDVEDGPGAEVSQD